MTGEDPSYDMAAIRGLLLGAFTVEELRKLFLYTAHPELRLLTNEFAPSDGLDARVDKVIVFCEQRILFDVLLTEVARARPRRYEEYLTQVQQENDASPPAAEGVNQNLSLARADALTASAPASTQTPTPVEGTGSVIQVFISYAREDEEAARRLCDALRALPGVTPWLDKEKLLPGQDWEEAIWAALEESRFAILVLSSNSLDKRGFVQREVKAALRLYEEFPTGSIFVIPARVEECTPRNRELRKLQWVDLFPKWDTGVARIAEAVEQELRKEDSPEVKRLRELLALKAGAYKTNRAPLHMVEMAELYSLREQIKPDDAEAWLLLCSCLLEEGPAWYWLRAQSRLMLEHMLRNALAEPSPRLREAAIRMLPKLAGQDISEAIRVMLRDPVAGIREEAAWAANRNPDCSLIPGIVALHDDSDMRVRQAAYVALNHILSRLGRDGIDDARALLRDSNDSVRVAAIRVLGQHAGPEVTGDLLPLLDDSYRGAQDAAATALADIAAQEAVPALRERLYDSRGKVREAFVKALGKLVGSEMLPDLQRLLGDEEASVRKAAVTALAGVGGHEAARTLKSCLSDEDRGVRTTAAQAVTAALEGLGADGAAELADILTHREEDVWEIAAQALVNMEGTAAIPRLRKAAWDSEGELWQPAARAMRRILAESAREGKLDLVVLLADADSFIRWAAANASGEIELEEAGTALLALLEDENQSVRNSAAAALGKLKQRDAIPALAEMLKDEDEDARGFALSALGEIGQYTIIPGSEELLTNEAVGLRRIAAWTLGEISATEAIPLLREALSLHFAV